MLSDMARYQEIQDKMNSKKLKCMSETRTLRYSQGEGSKIMRIIAKGKKTNTKKDLDTYERKDSKQQSIT